MDQETEKYLRENFANTKNKVLAEHLGISESTLHRLVRKLGGLQKTPEFIADVQKEMLQQASIINKRNNYSVQRKYMNKLIAEGRSYPPFKKGDNTWDCSEEERQSRIAKSTASRNKTIAQERIRINWGMPQQTKLKLCDQNRPRVSAKYRLTKFLGYRFVEKWLFEYDHDTKRSTKLEETYFKKFRFRFREA